MSATQSVVPKSGLNDISNAEWPQTTTTSNDATTTTTNSNTITANNSNTITTTTTATATVSPISRQTLKAWIESEYMIALLLPADR